MSILGLRRPLGSYYRPPLPTFSLPSLGDICVTPEPSIALYAYPHPQFAAVMERTALILAEKYLANKTTSHSIPTDKSGNRLGAAELAQILLTLPLNVPPLKLWQSVEDRYGNFRIQMLQDWCLARREPVQATRDEEAADKENTPPLPPSLDDNVPTRPAEGGPASVDSHSPPVIPMAPSPNASRSPPASPILESSFIQTHIATTLGPTSQAPAPSHPLLAVPLPAGRPDVLPSDGDAVALSQDDGDALEPDVEEAEGLAAPGLSVPEDTSGCLSAQDEERPNSSPPVPHVSISSQAQPSHSVPLAAPPRTRLVRSNAVPNLLALRTEWTLQDDLVSPTLATQTGSRRRLRRDGEEEGGPSVVAEQHALGSTVSPGEGGRERKRAREEGPSVVAEQHALGSVSRGEGGRERKRAREEEDQEGREDRPGHLKGAGRSSVVAEQHALGSTISPDEGGRERKRARQEGQEDGEERPCQRARHDGFIANLLYSRFVPQYSQYLW
ncbi:hypothetical protein BDZ89DRAFT_1163676 [Hymenopellis radicata]|nr:hypothetical protein BDZ89DRAFT_1163676 [Hymenopellis radicata]